MMKYFAVGAVVAALVISLYVGVAYAIRESTKTERAKTKTELVLTCERSNTTRAKVNATIVDGNRKAAVFGEHVLRTAREHPTYYTRKQITGFLSLTRLIKQLEYVHCQNMIDRIFEQIDAPRSD